MIWVTCTLRKSLDRSVLESFAKAEKLTSVKPRGILRWKNSNLHKSISTSTFHFETFFIIWYFWAENGHFWTILYKNDYFYYSKMDFWTVDRCSVLRLIDYNWNIFIEFLLFYILFYNSHIFTISNCSFWHNNGPNLYHFLIIFVEVGSFPG